MKIPRIEIVADDDQKEPPMRVKIVDVDLPFGSVFGVAFQFWIAGVLIGGIVGAAIAIAYQMKWG